MLTLRIKSLSDVLPNDRAAREAAARGVHALVVQHLRDRDMSRPPRENGMRHSGYWGVVADDVRVAGNVIEIAKEGAALHFYGGTVLPQNGKKALAIPKSPKVGDMNPAEYDPTRTAMRLLWPSGETAGQLRDDKTDELLYLLVPKATMDPDPSVLPKEDDMIASAEDAVFAEMDSRA